MNNFRKNLTFPESFIFGCFTVITLNKEKEKEGILPVLYPTSAALRPRQKHLRDPCALECLLKNFSVLVQNSAWARASSITQGGYSMPWLGPAYTSAQVLVSPLQGSLQPSCPHMVPIGCAKEQQDSYPLAFPEASSQVLVQGGSQTSWSFLLASTVFL